MENIRIRRWANGFFGQISKQFSKNENIFDLIQQQCNRQIYYISKIGFCYFYPYNYQYPVKIKIKTLKDQNYKIILLGKTGILEYEDVQIIDLIYAGDVDLQYPLTIDYQITLDEKEDNLNESVFDQ